MGRNLKRLAVSIGGAMLLAACTSTAPKYIPSVENVGLLKNVDGAKAKVADFSTAPKANSIQLRARTMLSPIGGSYGAYLADAARQELDLARRLDPNADIEISGAVLKNDIDIGGFIHGSGILEAKVAVKKGGQVRFEKTISATVEFDSSFAGAIAIPRGAQAYTDLVQKFLGNLFADPDFQSAMK